tara:strand:- start:764 stop:1186 length:423 start_codon:yes stop_codon:yes gene_type:complete
MSTHNPLSLTCRTLLIPVISALLGMGLLVEIITTPTTAKPVYARNVDILIIDDGAYYIDDTDAESFDDYTRYNEYDEYDEYSKYNENRNSNRPYDMYDNEHNQQFKDTANTVFDLIEQNLMLDHHTTDDGIYFQDGFQTI